MNKFVAIHFNIILTLSGLKKKKYFSLIHPATELPHTAPMSINEPIQELSFLVIGDPIGLFDDTELNAEVAGLTQPNIDPAAKILRLAVKKFKLLNDLPFK